MNVVFLIDLLLLMAQVALEFAAGTKTSKALNWSIRKVFVVPPSAYPFSFLIKESSSQKQSYWVLLEVLYNHLAWHGTLWKGLHSVIRFRKD